MTVLGALGNTRKKNSLQASIISTVNQFEIHILYPDLTLYVPQKLSNLNIDNMKVDIQEINGYFGCYALLMTNRFSE